MNAQDENHYNRLRIHHKNTANKAEAAPEAMRITDGGPAETVAGTGTASNMPDLTWSNTLWARVCYNGSTVTVKCLQDDVDAPTEQEWSGTSLCYSTTNLGSAGHIGFGAGDGYVDDLTIKPDTDEDGSFDDETADIVEDFNVTSGSAEDKFEHDAAGNLTYDGLRAYGYDAWSRLAEVKRAYPDDDDGDSDCEKGSWIATLRYDALGRRIVKAVDNSADWDCTYHYYYDGWRIAEVRNGSDVMLSQNVWGLLYVDELIQTGINQTWWDTTAPIKSYMRYFWILQDANFNCLGAVARNGRLVERYEYTPYGQRTVYGHTWNYYDINDDGQVGIAEMSAYADWSGQDVPPAPERLDYSADGSINFADFCALADNYGRKDASGNDPRVMHPRLESGGGRRGAGRCTPVGVCDFGHQGLLYDKEFGLYYNRFRYLDPRSGRFTQWDPIGYEDGLNLYENVGSNPVTYLDPLGTDRWVTGVIHLEITYPVYDKNCCIKYYRRCEFYPKMDADSIPELFYQAARKWIGSLIAYAPGDVYCRTIQAKDVTGRRSCTSCEADRKLHRWMRNLEKDPPDYRFGHNCQSMVLAWLRYGLVSSIYDKWGRWYLQQAAKYERWAKHRESIGDSAGAAYNWALVEYYMKRAKESSRSAEKDDERWARFGYGVHTPFFDELLWNKELWGSPCSD